MGTNYYVDWNPSYGPSDGPASLNFPPVTVRMHICKSLVMFQGTVFNSWSAWRNFLTRNGDYLTIRDEYRATVSVTEFVTSVEATTQPARGRQYRWMIEHYGVTTDWLDADGFSFCAGEFS